MPRLRVTRKDDFCPVARNSSFWVMWLAARGVTLAAVISNRSVNVKGRSNRRAAWIFAAVFAGVGSIAPTTAMSQRGRIIGVGGIFFKSANQQQLRDWYAKHLGIVDSGQGAMLPWREADHPENAQMTVWSIFPGTTKYFGPGDGQFMLNYIVDDLDALLDRLRMEGVRIDEKRQNASYGRFAWIYDADGNKIELWQPVHGHK